MTIAGYMVDIADPEGFDFTGTSVIPSDQHDLPRANAFYIGGDTPHVWTKEQIVRQSNRYRLPIWVYDPNRPGDGKTDAVSAVNACTSLGIPKGKLICLDMETHVDEEYTSAFHDGIIAGGYQYVLYESEGIKGSENIVGGNDPWTAHWTKVAHIETGSWATQYASATQLDHPFDISAVSSFTLLWDIKAAQEPPPPVLPEPDGLLVLPSLATYKIPYSTYKDWTEKKA